MKALLFIWLFFYCCFAVKSQHNTDYSAIDSKMLQIPKTKSYVTDSIVKFVQKNFITDAEKVRAIYTWITTNIRYSKDSMYYFRGWGADPETKMAGILRRRRGVCENYAALFANLVSKCGVPVFVVSGYTKFFGYVNWTGHGWCAVFIENKWRLCDPTWDEGFKATTQYFLVDPAQFIETHMPFDPLWQLLEHPITHKEFQKGIGLSKKDTAVFHYTDSVNSHLLLDTLQQMQATSRRMQKAGIDNENLKTWLAYNEMKIAIVNQESDMDAFNSAVADRNKARALYNDIVQYRNNRLTPARPAIEIQSWFNTIDSLLAAGLKKIDTIGRLVENYQYDTDSLKSSIDTLSVKLQQQKDFFKIYWGLSEGERIKLLE